MTEERNQPLKTSLAFDVWKLQLRRDCESNGKLFAFDAMGDYVLHLLWATGLDPTVQAILEYPAGHRTKPN